MSTTDQKHKPARRQVAARYYTWLTDMTTGMGQVFARSEVVMFRAKGRGATLMRIKPHLEALEDRCLLSGNVLQTNLVSDLPGVAQFLDPNLVNPWGISESAGSPFWISDNNAGVTTLYNTQGVAQPITKGQTQNFATIPSPGDLT